MDLPCRLSRDLDSNDTFLIFLIEFCVFQSDLRCCLGRHSIHCDEHLDDSENRDNLKPSFSDLDHLKRNYSRRFVLDKLEIFWYIGTI